MSDTKNPHMRVIQRRPSIRSDSVYKRLFIYRIGIEIYWFLFTSHETSRTMSSLACVVEVIEPLANLLEFDI